MTRFSGSMISFHNYLATCMIISSCCIGNFYSPIDLPYISNIPKKKKVSKKYSRKENRKPLKSECKAQILLADMIGFDQWKIYRKTNRIILKPNKHFYIIGDYFGSYNKFYPFSNKPDVVRIDDIKRLYATNFCAIQSGGEDTPYTDKVILFALNLINDEKDFLKTVNRIGEKKFNTIKECAHWNINGKKDTILYTKDIIKSKFESMKDKICKMI